MKRSLIEPRSDEIFVAQGEFSSPGYVIEKGLALTRQSFMIALLELHPATAGLEVLKGLNKRSSTARQQNDRAMDPIPSSVAPSALNSHKLTASRLESRI